MFPKPNEQNFTVIYEVLTLLGNATGLKTDLDKSSILPIRCENTDLAPLQLILCCPISAFLCKYLEIPLSDRRLTKAHLREPVELMATKTVGWKAIPGRQTLVKFVLAAMATFQLMAIEFPK
jgi:hypothetical protein